jgi:uncharacterized protein
MARNSTKKNVKPLVIGGVDIAPGERKHIEIPISKMYTDINVSMPVVVVRGKKDGPTIFVSAAVHGDELNGIEIIRRLLQYKYTGLKGTLITVPIVNPLGVLNQSRYMPDRRDLNRCFPGSSKGSLAARSAHLFFKEVVSKCQYGIDLHTGAVHRSNLPQIRAQLSDEKTLELAKAFGVPVIMNSELRDGSLRQTASEVGVKTLLYEAGEALRFDEVSIRAGVKGIINVMRSLGMLRPSSKRSNYSPIKANSSSWVRATASGFVSHKKELGDLVAPGDELAHINDPFGVTVDRVISAYEGVVIGKQNIPLTQEGEAMYHIAMFKDSDTVAEQVEIMQDVLLPENSNTVII